MTSDEVQAVLRGQTMKPVATAAVEKPMFSYEKVKQRYNVTIVKMSGRGLQMIESSLMPPVPIFDLSISPRLLQQRRVLDEPVKLPLPTGEAIVIVLRDVPEFGIWVKLPESTEVPLEDLQAAAVQEVVLALECAALDVSGSPLVPKHSDVTRPALLPSLSPDAQVSLQAAAQPVQEKKIDLAGFAALNACLRKMRRLFLNRDSRRRA